jgi:hypothetical protein
MTTVLATNEHEAMVGPTVESGGVWSQGVGFCWCVRQEYGFSPKEDVFTFNLIYTRNHNILQTLQFKCDLQKNDAARICITLQHKKTTFR